MSESRRRLLAPCLAGALRIRKGDFAGGVSALRGALDDAGARGLMIRKPDFLGILAEGLAGCGRYDEALATANEALATADREGQRWFAAEPQRIRGEILIAIGEPLRTAEACFADAIETARAQGTVLAIARQRRSGAADGPGRARCRGASAPCRLVPRILGRL